MILTTTVKNTCLSVALCCGFLFVVVFVTYPAVADVTPLDGRVCAEVLTTARNSENGEIRVFPNACIPEGWEVYGEKKGVARKEQLTLIRETAALLARGDTGILLERIGKKRNRAEEQFTRLTYLKNLTDDLAKLSEKIRETIMLFVAYGVDDNSKAIGQGERAAVVYSFR